MEVTYLDHLGSDLTVVNAARVSFGKRKEVFDEKDARLIRYLAEHKHMLPFRHPHVSFHFKAPIFVARQLGKHQVGMSWSEISRRYVKSDPEVWWPDYWRKANPDIKQGSIDEKHDLNSDISLDALKVCAAMLNEYRNQIALGVAPEQARALLPQNVLTEWVWTGSLLSWAHLWNLRVKPDAQKETRQIVEMIGPDMERLFPASWEVLTNGCGT